MPEFLEARLRRCWPTVKARSHRACRPLPVHAGIASPAADMARHFLDPQLQAPNVREVTLDLQKLSPALALAPQMQALTDADQIVQLEVAGRAVRLSAKRPRKWNSDIAWWSADDQESFAYFQRLFDDLRMAEVVAPYVDYRDQIRLFAGFFVVRRWCREETMHVDWIDGQNDGFTLLAPLTDNCAEMGLAYEDFRSQRRVYSYATGRGVVFGDRFLHSTEAGEAERPAVLLCFNFGTDKMDRWPQLSKTTARQGRLHRRPDGVFVQDGVPLASG